MIAIDKKSKRERKLYAQFDTIKNQQFPLKFREATTKANPTTKTFKITLVMEAPETYNILPGMTGTVYAEMFPSETGEHEPVTLPVSAVISDNKKQATVWIVDEATMTARPKNVTTGVMLGDGILVNGLVAGERVVIAGAAFLRENMKVTLMKTGEQP